VIWDVVAVRVALDFVFVGDAVVVLISGHGKQHGDFDTAVVVPAHSPPP
jgi:hypothetical protein